jgi:hypothetical protein
MRGDSFVFAIEGRHPKLRVVLPIAEDCLAKDALTAKTGALVNMLRTRICFEDVET